MSDFQENDSYSKLTNSSEDLNPENSNNYITPLNESEYINLTNKETIDIEQNNSNKKKENSTPLVDKSNNSNTSHKLNQNKKTKKETYFNYQELDNLDSQSNNNNSNSKENNEYCINSNSSNKTDNIIKNESNKKEEKNNVINMKPRTKRKTFFNYDEDFDKQEKAFLENYKITEDSNNTKKQENEKNEKNNSNIIINYHKNYSFGNKDINESQSARFNSKTQSAEKEQQNNQHKEYKENKEYKEYEEYKVYEEYKGHKESKPQLINQSQNELINSRDYYFNYRNEELFNKINVLTTKREKNVNENNDTFKYGYNHDYNDNNKKITDVYMKNEYNYYSNNANENHKEKKENIYNNIFINSKSDNFTNFYDSKNSYNTIDTLKINEVKQEENDIQNQIHYEEERLKVLEKEKNKLIKEDEKRRQIISDEINKNEIKKIEMKRKYEQAQEQKIRDIQKLNNIKMLQERNQKEIKELLIKTKKDEEQLKALNQFKVNIKESYIDSLHEDKGNSIIMKNNGYDYAGNSNDNKNYYNEYLKEIQKRNELINQKNLELVRSKINNLRNDNYYDNTNINSHINRGNLNIKNQKILYKSKKSYNHKKIKKEEYIPNINNENKINNEINYNLYSNELSTYNNNNDDKRSNNDSLNRYNLNVYFRLHDKEKYSEISNSDSNVNNEYNKKTYYNRNGGSSRTYKNINSSTKNSSTKNDNKLNMYYSNNYRNNEYTKLVHNRGRNHSISLTPNGLYRSKKTEYDYFNNYGSELDDIKNINEKYQTEFKTNTKDEIIKSFDLINNNNNNFINQKQLYRSKLDPEQLYSNYAKERVKAINSARNLIDDINKYKNRNKNNNFKNEYNGNQKIITYTHSSSNLNSVGINKSNYNEYLTKYNSELNNKVYNDGKHNNNHNYNIKTHNIDNNINNNIINTKLNTYRTSCSLMKEKSYSNLQNLFKMNNDDNNNNGHKLINYLKDFNNKHSSLTDHRSYRSSSHIVNENNFNKNLSLKLKRSNMKNNLNYNNDYICDKCLSIRLFNNNIINNKSEVLKDNLLGDHMKFCPNCQKLFNDINYN